MRYDTARISPLALEVTGTEPRVPGAGAPEPTGPDRSPARRLAGRITRYGIGVIAAVVALVVVFGRRGELSGAAATLGHLSWGWVLVASGAEAASAGSYAVLYWRLLRCGGAHPLLGVRPLTAITLASNAIQSSLPAGPAWSNLYAFRQVRRRGADPVLAAWTLVVANVLTFVTLSLIALAGVAAAEGQASSLGLIQVVLAVAVIGVLLAVAVRAGVLKVTAVGPALMSMGSVGVRVSQKLLHRPAGEPETIVREAWSRLRAVQPSRRDLAVCTAWGLANWLFDLACLGLAFRAIHAPVPWRGLLLAYGAGQLAANLPLTLGGLGVVEGSLTVALVYYGGAHAATVAAVLMYRILSFWVMLPIGWSCALGLRLSERRGRGSGDLAVSSLGAQ